MGNNAVSSDMVTFFPVFGGEGIAHINEIGIERQAAFFVYPIHKVGRVVRNESFQWYVKGGVKILRASVETEKGLGRDADSFLFPKMIGHD